jgi:hypothetical protein
MTHNLLAPKVQRVLADLKATRVKRVKRVTLVKWVLLVK